MTAGLLLQVELKNAVQLLLARVSKLSCSKEVLKPELYEYPGEKDINIECRIYLMRNLGRDGPL